MRFDPPNADAYYVHAVDLGKRRPGLASALVVGGRATVFQANTVEFPGGAWDAEVMAQTVHGYLGEPGLPEVWVCEWPQKRPKRRKYHDDLDDLREVGTRLARLRGFRWAQKWYPMAWKGNVPKAAYHRRMWRAVPSLEMKLLESSLVARGRPLSWLDSNDAHDARDALGVLLFALGRLRVGGRCV